MANKSRPKNLDLFTFRFPITAIVSILHRISGVLLFIGVPILIYFLSCALKSEEGFVYAQQQLSHPMIKFIVWGIWAAFTYHLLAGVRHIIMDFGVAESKKSGCYTSYLILSLTIFFVVIEALWLWGIL